MTPSTPRTWLWSATAVLLFAPAGWSDEPTLDELLGTTGSEETVPPAQTETTEPEVSVETPQADPALDELLAGERPTETFESAVAEMGQVTTRLDARDPGLPTQRLQQRILDRLDKVIAAASSPPPSGGGGKGKGSPKNSDNQKNQQGGQGKKPGQGSGKPSAQPGGAAPNQGQFSPGQVGPVEPEAKSMDELRTEWGALPPRLRDELSDGLDEPYSPIYRDVTERYYRRLAEEAGR